MLHQLLIRDRPKDEATRTRNFVGHWTITEFSELDQGYLDESDELPFLTIRRSAHEQLYGDYHFGLSGGRLEGQLREFGGEPVVLFDCEGSDEMDPAHGAGWARLEDRDRLVGEFLDYGRFTAVRKLLGTHQRESRSTKRR